MTMATIPRQTPLMPMVTFPYPQDSTGYAVSDR
jgi:hypothetical protein